MREVEYSVSNFVESLKKHIQQYFSKYCLSEVIRFSHLSEFLRIPFQKNCIGLAAKHESKQFSIHCASVNRFLVRALCINRNKCQSEELRSGLQAGEEKLPNRCFSNSCWTFNMKPAVVMMKSIASSLVANLGSSWATARFKLSRPSVPTKYSA